MIYIIAQIKLSSQKWTNLQLDEISTQPFQTDDYMFINNVTQTVDHIQS